jgi:SAM-dependent methyltransferase
MVERGQHEHYRDAALYDYEYRRRRRDANFYRKLAEEVVAPGGAILELACGSGRITRTLLAGGFQVIGLDLSGAMLARARYRIDRLSRSARKRVHLVRADMRRFALDRQFPLIVMAFNSFEHLYTRVDVQACLAGVRAHLAPGGQFAFDVQNPDLHWLVRDPNKRWARTRFRHPETGEQLIYSTSHVYDPVSQIAIIRLHYEPVDHSRRARFITLSQRKFFPAELEALLHAGGFRVTARYGDFDREPLSAEAESQVLVCRVAG